MSLTVLQFMSACLPQQPVDQISPAQGMVMVPARPLLACLARNVACRLQASMCTTAPAVPLAHLQRCGCCAGKVVHH